MDCAVSPSYHLHLYKLKYNFRLTVIDRN